MAAAARLLDDKGEAALSMRALARAVGAAPQSVYLHFTDREQLLWAVLREYFSELQEHLDAAEATGSDAGARLRARCLALCTYGLEHPRRYRLLFTREAPIIHDVDLDELPGAAVFRSLETAVHHYLRANEPTNDISVQDLFVKTADLAAVLHGASLLRAGTPSFPWPPVEGLIDRAISQLRIPTEQPSP